MYRVYVDDELLYSPEISLNDPGYALINASMSLELNKAGSVQFTISPTHRLYNKLTHLSTDVRVVFTKGGSLPEKTRFYGRVFDTTRDRNNNKDVVCEGDLAFLNDSIQRPFGFVQSPKWAFSTFVRRHNFCVVGSPNRTFEIGRCDMATTESAVGASSYGAYIYTAGTMINHTNQDGATAVTSEITDASIGMLYLNRNTYGLYKCTVGGNPNTAVWAYVGNIQSVIGNVDSSNLIFHGDEISGTFSTPLEFNLYSSSGIEVGDRYINNTTYCVYKCVQRELTEEERQETTLSYDEYPKNLWSYMGSIAPMVLAADRRVSSNAIFFNSDDYSNSWELFSNTLVNSLGGYLYTSDPSNGGKTRFINWTKEPGVIANQIIRFGSNLLDFSECISAENIVTRVIPLGAELVDENGNSVGGRVTINLANGGVDYIQSELGIKTFGIITRVVVFENGTSPEILKKLAEDYLDEALKLAITIELTAFDMSLIDINADDIRVGNRYRVVAEPYGVDDYFLCSKADIDILKPDQSRFTFGFTGSALTSLTSKSNYVASASAPVISQEHYVPTGEVSFMTTRDPEEDELVDFDDPQYVGDSNEEPVNRQDAINVSSTGVTLSLLENGTVVKSSKHTYDNFCVTDGNNPQLSSGLVYWSMLSQRRQVKGDLYVTVYHCGNLFWAHFDGEISPGWSGILNEYLPIVENDDNLSESIFCAPPQNIITHALPYTATNPRLSISVRTDGRLGLSRIVYPIQGNANVTVQDYIQSVDIFWAHI